MPENTRTQFDEIRNYFMTTPTEILTNSNLRTPQIQSYFQTAEHFAGANKQKHAIIIVPTGVGKTGIMGILPFGISQGRVLIITPQVSIRESVIKALDPSNPNNFYIKHAVIKNSQDLPILVEFTPNLRPSILKSANIVILNIHKLQTRLESSPINKLSNDFFDMIIIDEAHHSTARTWLEATHHFKNAKVVKLTATPFRTDNQSLTGIEVYRYKLSQAMHHGYVKSLNNIVYIPDELKLTIDDNQDRLFTIEKLLELGLKDEEWISRSVAYSKSCSESVAIRSLERLKILKEHSNLPHKIIAVGASIKHAEMIQEIYKKHSSKSVIIHSYLDPDSIDKAYSDIENNRVDVVIQVGMLNEGYDHCFLSIAAIFKPYRNVLPYTQFVGRILRRIPKEYNPTAADNIGEIISHRHLGLELMWDYYKKEINESEIIDEVEEIPIDDNYSIGDKEHREIDLGNAFDSLKGETSTDTFLTTETIQQSIRDKQEFEIKVGKIIKLLNVSKSEAENIVKSSSAKEYPELKRPDILYKLNRKNIDDKIREDIVPMIINECELSTKGIELADCKKIFNGNYMWIANKKYNNGAMLAIYFNEYLRQEIGKKREEWELQDLSTALELLEEISLYVRTIVEDFVKKIRGE